MPSISVTSPSSPVSYSQASKFYHLHRMSCSSWKPEHDNESVYSARFQCVNFDSEDLERYEPGGFHPVHLGDYYDDMRYKIVHKLGAGGFSTVWLARDELEQKWVALKILLADKSVSVKAKSLSLQDTVQRDSRATFVVQHRHFMINGPNGLHLCLVLPVLGPSASQLSHGFDSRITPRLSRSTGYQITKALADLHAQGFCHGDLTTANIVFTLLNFDQYTEDDIYRQFGNPVQQSPETESGETPAGPECPKYVVKAIDFLSAEENIISKDIRLIDFDQSFPVTSPPEDLLGTPAEWLAPVIAVGHKPSPASDVWALGCCLFRLRAGECPFTGYEVTSPADLMRVIIQYLGDIPNSWGVPLFDFYGPGLHKTLSKGKPLTTWFEKRTLKDLVNKIWDQPENGIVHPENAGSNPSSLCEEEIHTIP